jgi:hypothetical protein
VEEQGEAGWITVDFGNDDFRCGPLAEQLRSERRFIGNGFMGELFVLAEFADEGQDLERVGFVCRPETDDRSLGTR